MLGFRSFRYTAFLLVIAVTVSFYLYFHSHLKFKNIRDHRNTGVRTNRLGTVLHSDSTNKSALKKFFTDREKVYETRRVLVQKQCRALGRKGTYSMAEWAPLERLRWHMQNKLVMCFNAKVGTSTWLLYLMDSAFPGILKNSTKNWHNEAIRYLRPPQGTTRSQAAAILQTFSKVMVVRDPFARIVSAYRNKIFNTTSGFFSRLSKAIIWNARRGNNSSISTVPYPTFREFVWFIVVTTPADEAVWKKSTNYSNWHWYPYYANCAPCDIHYDVIAKMETIGEDTRYILDKYNLQVPEMIWANSNEGKSSDDVAVDMFKEVPRRLKLALYQRYRPDFLMFGYSVEKYLKTEIKLIQ